jgi:hypothetical protein
VTLQVLPLPRSRRCSPIERVEVRGVLPVSGREREATFAVGIPVWARRILARLAGTGALVVGEGLVLMFLAFPPILAIASLHIGIRVNDSKH